MKTTILLKPLVLGILLFFYACSCDHENNADYHFFIIDKNAECYIAPEGWGGNNTYWQTQLVLLENATDTEGNICDYSNNYLSSVEPLGGKNDIISQDGQYIYRVSLNPNDTQSIFIFNANNGETQTVKFEYDVEEKYYRSCGQYHVSFSNITITENTFTDKVYAANNEWMALYINE